MDRGSLDALDVWVMKPGFHDWTESIKRWSGDNSRNAGKEVRQTSLRDSLFLFSVSWLLGEKKNRNKILGHLMSWGLFIPAKSSSFLSFSTYIQERLWIKAKVNVLHFLDPVGRKGIIWKASCNSLICAPGNSYGL